jgi:hypothetical protein
VDDVHRGEETVTKNLSEALKNIQDLPADEIRLRIVELNEEEKALRVLLRSRSAADRIRKKAIREGTANE